MNRAYLVLVGATIPADYDYSCPCCSWLVASSSFTFLATPARFLDGPVLKDGKSCIPALGTAPSFFFPLQLQTLDFSCLFSASLP